MKKETSKKTVVKQALRTLGAFCVMYGLCAISAGLFGLISYWLGLPAVFGWISGASAMVVFVSSTLLTDVTTVLDANMRVINHNVQTLAVMLSNMAKLQLMEHQVENPNFSIKNDDDLVH